MLRIHPEIVRVQRLRPMTPKKNQNQKYNPVRQIKIFPAIGWQQIEAPYWPQWERLVISAESVLNSKTSVFVISFFNLFIYHRQNPSVSYPANYRDPSLKCALRLHKFHRHKTWSSSLMAYFNIPSIHVGDFCERETFVVM